MNGSRTSHPALKLAKDLARRRAHLMRLHGHTNAEITRELDVDRSTVQSWLKRPCPTEEEIERLQQEAASQSADAADTVALKAYLAKEYADGLAAQAAARGVSRVRLLNCAVRMYLDVLRRLDGELTGPIDVHGFRP